MKMLFGKYLHKLHKLYMIFIKEKKERFSIEISNQLTYSLMHKTMSNWEILDWQG